MNLTKKNFKTSFNDLLNEKTLTQKSSKSKEVRATFIVKEANLEKLKAISYWQRKLIKEVLDQAIITYIENYEQKNGAIQLPK